MTENDMKQKADEPDGKARHITHNLSHYMFVRPDQMVRHNVNALLHPLHQELIKDDGDTASVVSESGLSDVSRNTDISMNSIVERNLVKSRLDNPTLKKNFSCADMPRLEKDKVSNTQQQQQQHCLDSGFKQPQRLPSIMLWNWINSHKYHAPTGIASEAKSTADTIAQGAVDTATKTRFTMRDLNAYAPTGF